MRTATETPPSRSRTRRALTRLLSAGTAALLTAALLPAAPAAATTVTVTHETIMSHDGARLSAKVITPGTDGPHPLLVMPAAWGTPNLIYVGAAHRLAYESGYQVVAYTSRGFYDSGGGIEVAGPEDRADASAVIDWALANTDADPDLIGMAGISYGAGISLLTAAEDERVDAVAALSGWADLEASLYPNRTINEQAAELLLLAGNLTGSPGDKLRMIEEEYRDGNVAPIVEASVDRSAMNKVGAINANGTAVMMAHTWNDGIFNPNQITDFYEALEGPKRLMLAPGDHATQDAFGALGLPDEVWSAAGDWFDHHLLGEDNGVADADPVRVKPNNGRGDWTSHPDWASVTGQADEYYLDKPSTSWLRWQSRGAMADEPATGWSYRYRSGYGTNAQSGTILLTGALQQFFDVPTGVSLPRVDRYHSAVWTSPAYPDGARIAGTPRAEFTAAPTSADQTLYVYLYDIDAWGRGALVSHAPYSLHGATPGEPVQVGVDLQDIVWDVPAGHRLAVVVDSGDLRYSEENDPWDRVTVGSDEESPARVTVPLG
ncbi:CocE/NonD family hydrolase [Nocardiopsis sp. LOL_012]|uniref:CocE/NonD family hydrolase n=1 Tax=Nocardiopsis sp. LOL_012 TaxID=3345409 RepID=UPI003A84F3A9